MNRPGFFKIFSSAATLIALCLQLFVSHMLIAHAEGASSVVINEVAWAGTTDNSNDEWIELYNTTSQTVDLSNWYIEDDYVDKYIIVSGTIPAHGYFLIEDSENTVSGVAADAVIPLSLANSGDSLILKNASGTVIDSVNSTGGAWYAGNSTSKATMERIDPLVGVDSAANFASASAGNGSVGSGGSSILGTPKGQNSVYQGAPSSTNVEFDLSNENPLSGENVTATVIINNANDLFAYGFDVAYNSSVLEYVSGNEAGFLSGNGSVSTAFNTALENGAAGKLIIGNARLVSPATGVSGSGNLFTLTFKVIGAKDSASDLVFGSGSFISDSKGDVLATFKKASLKVGANQIDSVGNLVGALGTDIYTLKLNWTAPSSGADSYIILRKGVDGKFTQIGTSTTASFIDNDTLSSGGKIVPKIIYQYQVKAVKNGIQSNATTVSCSETRGLVGDNNRSGRVDGRDVELLARHYGAKVGDSGFNPLADTTFDGNIDGSDLIDIGANFGFVYE
jgi:hypothetical protein